MQSLYAQCWENAMAYAPEGPYRVPMPTHARAVSFRANCNRYRRKIATDIYGEAADNHPFYELEVIIEELDQLYVTFQRRPKIWLPPVPGTGMWCVIRRADGFVVEQHQLPVTDPGFVSGHDSKEAAEKSAAVEASALKGPIFPVV